MDSSHISLVELNLTSEWFDKYKIDKPHTFGLSITCLDLIISCLDKNFKIIMNHKEEGDHLNITLTDDKIIKNYRMVLIDIESNMLNVPNPEYSADVTIKSSVYKDYINELIMFGEDLYVDCTQENVKLHSRGDYGKSEIIINEEYLEEYAIEEGINISQYYNLKMVKCFTNFTKLNKIVKFHLLKDNPMKIIYELSEENPEKNSLKFYLAPKVDD
jgi:proliferating cell nuclear antigen